jgi:hypothetical protein
MNSSAHRRIRMSDVPHLLKQLDDARAKMREVVAMADENQPIYQPWRMKEVLDHITGWDDAVIASINSILAGREPATPAVRGINTYNAETVTTRETIPYKVTLRKWETSREELKRLISIMPEGKLYAPFVFPWGENGTIETLVIIFSEHEEEHALEIKNLIREAR